jgi:hypothetical protein
MEVLTQKVRGARTEPLRFSLSKISSVGVQVLRGRRVVWSRPAGLLGYGERSVSWWAPRKGGRYELRIDAKDLAGNASTVTAPLEVTRAPKPRKRGSANPRRG